MKIPERLHRWAEVDADAWIFDPQRTGRMQRCADRLMAFVIVFGAIYLAWLLVKAVLFAAVNY